jgi:hypothetical protein
MENDSTAGTQTAKSKVSACEQMPNSQGERVNDLRKGTDIAHKVVQ